MNQNCSTSSTISGYAEDTIRKCEELPFTGTEVGLIVVAGIILIIVGTSAIIASRLKRIPDDYQTDYDAPYSDLPSEPYDYTKDGE